jgi:hypothetical protein
MERTRASRAGRLQKRCVAFSADCFEQFLFPIMKDTDPNIGLQYDNRFCWVTRWNTEGIIVQVRAYLDSALVQRAITENESGEHTYTDQRAVLAPGPVGINCATEG